MTWACQSACQIHTRQTATAPPYPSASTCCPQCYRQSYPPIFAPYTPRSLTRYSIILVKKIPLARTEPLVASLTFCTSPRPGAMDDLLVIKFRWRPNGSMDYGLAAILLRKFTLFMKSAAYTLHLLGKSYIRIPACFAKI